MGYRNGEEVEAGIRFGNKRIVRLPPERDYYYVYYEGTKRGGKPFNVELVKLNFEDVQWSFRKRAIDLPPKKGNYELMQHWIDNMWEALYNPIWLLKLRPGDKHLRTWAVVSGQHRLRLMDAMEPNHIWVYVSEYGYERFDWRITRQDVSKKIRSIMELNDRPPRKGTMSGRCESCGELTAWKKVTVGSKLDGVHMYCKKCGEENPYPWPGRL